MSMSTEFPAHIRLGEGDPAVQSVQEHCRETAQIAAETLRAIGVGSGAYLAGLLHDAGKFTQAFRY